MAATHFSRATGLQRGLTRLLFAAGACLAAVIGLTSHTLADGTPMVEQTFENRMAPIAP